MLGGAYLLWGHDVARWVGDGVFLPDPYPFAPNTPTPACWREYFAPIEDEL